MSKTRKRREEAQMPIAGAGLIRFFQDESTGLKVGPKAVVIGSVLIMLAVFFLYLMFPLS
ncbi:MAG: preprotein translocase subunit Sec61beta [Candidatus Odinarchaeota archaeon]